MLNYEEMRYIAAFAETGTLSGTAERYHISQPTLTRVMKKAEAEFGVPLFDRTKNSIKFNDNGLAAAGEISQILKQTDEMISRVRAYDKANRTISIGTGAAVQLPELVRCLTGAYPEKSISMELKKPPELLDGLEKNIYQLIILPFRPEKHSYWHEKIGEEHLMFLLPEKHPLAGRESLSLSDLNGENMLLFYDIGFWADVVKNKMPDSKFLVQNERYSFEELVANSILPCFTSDLVMDAKQIYEGRIAIPITDPEVNVSYYLAGKTENKKYFEPLLTSIRK